jgi:hypothetical protein
MYETQGDESYKVIRQLFVVNHLWGKNSQIFTRFTDIYLPVPVAARSKAAAEIVGSNPTGGMDVCLL